MIALCSMYFGAATLWLLSATAGAQNSTPPVVRNGAIQGIVTEGATGRALGNVEVWLERPEPPARDPLQRAVRPVEELPYVTVTGPDGRFLLEDTAPGEYRLFADGDGLLQQEYGQKSPETRGTVIPVRAGDRLSINFRMRPTGTISGYVLDEAGEPVPGIPLYAQVFQFRSGKNVLLDLSELRVSSARRVGSVTPEMGYSVTDDKGAYRLTGLPPGDYYVVVRHQPGEEVREGFNLIVERDPLAPVYYPDTLRVDDAVAVGVAGNEVFGVNIRWRAVQPVSVRGELVGFGGDGPPTRFIVTTPEGAPVPALSATPVLDADGRFELLLPPFQSYLLIATKVGTEGYSGMTRIDIADSDLDGISVVLQPPVAISGQILVSSGADQPDFFQLFVELENGWDGMGYSGVGSIGTRVQPDGSFRIQRIRRRNGYRLSVENLPEGYYMESAIFGATDALKGSLDLTAALPDGILTIRLRSAPGEVTGTVVDAMGDPHAGAKVTLVPGGIYTDRYDRYKSALTDEEGRFRLEAVPPGPYQIIAWETIAMDAEMNADFLAPFRGRGRSVRIEQAGTVDIELRIIDEPF